MSVLISIVIPLYNVERYVEECLQSCLKQNNAYLGKDYEIIIVNDGSTDNSAEIASGIIKDKKGCSIINQKNKGLSGARNTGLNNANGKYVWFVDSDDRIVEDAICRISSELTKFEPELLQMRGANIIDGEAHIRGFHKHVDDGVISGLEVFNSGDWETCAPFIVMNTDFLKRHNLRFFEGIYHEDNEFTPRLLLTANSVRQTNDVLYLVTQNPNSITRSVNYKKAFDLLIIVEELSKFMHRRQLSDDVAKKLSSFISLTLNSSFFATRGMSRDLKKQYKAKLTLNKRYWHCLERSGILKYRLEYYLFKIFPNYLGVYRCLKHFSSRHFL